MLLDYIGQEVIWELRCNHPYKKNFATSNITVRATSEQENKDIVSFIMKHIKADSIIDIIMDDNIFNENGDKIVMVIKIRNVFGRESELKIFNQIKYDDIDSEIKKLKDKLNIKHD